MACSSSSPQKVRFFSLQEISSLSEHHHLWPIEHYAHPSSENNRVSLVFSSTISLFCLQFIADGVFFAELNDVLMRELAEVRVTPMRIEITIRATRYQNILIFLKFPSVIERRRQRATDEPGKQMRSDVRIKNTSSSHVASSLLLHVPETGSHESSGDPNASDDHSDAANDASDGSSPGDDSKNEVDDADFDVFNHVDSD
ncbi:hypothetical protein RHGRI_029390 [Rhododendron griersonianum]|uniref:Uncharacterized protein n=1 Tax=Rhododendron griersonianum TaxID=479676 RepID=A0AAV6IMW8_9ERIC|nr:hypothetical protein RHGRI_029390 [Rhododendron griersonianum]